MALTLRHEYLRSKASKHPIYRQYPYLLLIGKARARSSLCDCLDVICSVHLIYETDRRSSVRGLCLVFSKR